MRLLKIGFLGVLMAFIMVPAYAVDLFLEDASKQTAQKPVLVEKTSAVNVTDAKSKKPTISDAAIVDTSVVKVNRVQVQNNSQTKADSFTQLAVNLESILVRGDVQVFQERQRNDKWSTLLKVHVNPHDAFNTSTGDFGVSAGGRLYLSVPNMKKNAVFLEFSGGLNHFPGGDILMAVELGAGYRMVWESQLNVELMLAAHRGYQKSQEDPELYLGLNVGIDLDKPLLPIF